MKKYVYGLSLALVSAAMFAACSEDEGTDPGNDSKARVTLFQYTVAKPYDADADTEVRIVANSATNEAYALVEAQSDYESRVAELGTDGYNDYVVEKGEKVEGIDGFSSADKYFTGLTGDVAITVVAVGKGGKSSQTVNFTALAWENVTTGTFKFGIEVIQNLMGSTTAATTLQKCTNKNGLYRFLDLYGKGYNVKFTLTGDPQTDDSGNYYNCLIADQAIGLEYKTYGEVSVRDVATWQNDSYYLDYNVMYEDGYCQFYNQYHVTLGNIGCGLDKFYPGGLN